MAQKAQVVRGMRDIVPPDAELRRRVANRVLDVYARYGFEVIETPALEYLDVLTGSQGGENEKLIFKVLRRGKSMHEQLALLAGGEELAEEGMRFDLTVPLARFVANHLNELPMPFKVAHLGPVWRAERPQKGRYREFTQCDIDIVGEAGIAAEVELCLATLDVFTHLGIQGCTVRVNDRRILRAAVENYLGDATGNGDAVFITLDKVDKIGAEGVARELTAQGHGPHRVAKLLDWLTTAELMGRTEVESNIGLVIQNLHHAGLEAEFSPSLVRGMGYYTGTIFEVSHPDVPYSLAGGGRYDGMTARFGTPPLPMCGFSIGFERVLDLVDAGLFSTGHPKLAVTCASEEELLASLADARRQRAQDPQIVISVLRRARNIHKQKEDLLRLGYTEVIDGKDFAKQAE